MSNNNSKHHEPARFRCDASKPMAMATFASSPFAPSAAPRSGFSSAPVSFLTNLTLPNPLAAEHDGITRRFFSGETSSGSSTPHEPSGPAWLPKSPDLVTFGVDRSHGRDREAVGGSSKAAGCGPGAVAWQSSSPAGFFSNLLLDNPARDNNGSCSQAGADDVDAMDKRNLKSQLSFTRSNFSQPSDLGLTSLGESVGRRSRPDLEGSNSTRQYHNVGFSIDTWDETNSIVFSAPTGKRIRDHNGVDGINMYGAMESQFTLPGTSLEMESLDKFAHAQQDQVGFKIRAKRGCATHPRSIAERERRTRISEKLRRLQELVPNMDKQTSTADMLDLAIQQIKGLQKEVQVLSEERKNCTCSCTTDQN